MASKWALKPLGYSEVRWFKKIQPLIPLALGALVQGVTKDVLPILVGLFIFSIWLAWSLWPLASNISVWIVNRLRGFSNTPQVKRESRFLKNFRSRNIDVARLQSGMLEQNRKNVLEGIRSIVFILFCAGVFFLFNQFGIIYACTSFINDERAEIAKDLDGGLAFPFGRDGRAEVSIQNASNHDLILKQITCSFRQLRDFDGNQFPYFHGITRMNDLMLHRNKDTETTLCPQDKTMDFDSGGIMCGEVLWSVTYSITDIYPNKIEPPKQFRFRLDRGEKHWIQVALDSPPGPC